MSADEAWAKLSGFFPWEKPPSVNGRRGGSRGEASSSGPAARAPDGVTAVGVRRGSGAGGPSGRSGSPWGCRRPRTGWAEKPPGRGRTPTGTCTGGTRRQRRGNPAPGEGGAAGPWSCPPGPARPGPLEVPKTPLWQGDLLGQSPARTPAPSVKEGKCHLTKSRGTDKGVLNSVPPEIYPSADPWKLWRDLYLEIGSLWMCLRSLK